MPVVNGVWKGYFVQKSTFLVAKQGCQHVENLEKDCAAHTCCAAAARLQSKNKDKRSNIENCMLLDDCY